MHKRLYTLLAAGVIAAVSAAGETNLDALRAWPMGDQAAVPYEQDFATGDLKVFTSFPGYEIGNGGTTAPPVFAPNANPEKNTVLSRFPSRD